MLAIVGLLIICLIVIFLSIFIFSKYTGEIVSVTLGTFMLNLVILGMALKIGNNDSFVGAIGTESEKGNDQLNEYLKLLLLKKYQKGKISRRNLSLLMQSSDDDCMIKMKIIKELIIKITCQQLLEDKNKNNDINAVYNNFLLTAYSINIEESRKNLYEQIYSLRINEINTNNFKEKVLWQENIKDIVDVIFFNLEMGQNSIMISPLSSRHGK